MVQPKINSYYSSPQGYKPWYKKWYLYTVIAIVLIVGYGLVETSLAYKEIHIGDTAPRDKKTVWKSIGGLFNLNSGETLPIVDHNPMPAKESNRFDVLIMGMRGDQGEPETGQWLTDIIMLFSIDKTTGKTSLVSIPRDFYIDMIVPEFDENFRMRGKINEVYIKGVTNGSGVALSKQVISKLTGVYVDKFIVFDFEAFQKIVDAIGGIDIKLDQPFSEPKQWEYAFELPVGENHLDGQNALYYVRSRFSSSDFERSRRQNQVINAIKQKAISLGFLANPSKISDLLGVLTGNVRTDFQPWEINDAINLAQAFSDNTATHLVLSPLNALRESKGPYKEYILLPKEDDYEVFKKLFNTILE